jgi:predicted nucleotidyltransferase/biotin operon repressor
VAVLRELFRSKLGYSGNALALQTGIGRLAVQRTLETLEGIGLVEVERGNVEHRYRLNAHHYLVENALRPLFESEEHMSRHLAQDLQALLKGKVIAAGLFGSFARGAAGPGSDIDLLVVVQNEQDRERVSHILSDEQADLTRRYGWPLQPVIFELRRLFNRRTNGPALLDSAALDWQAVTGLSPAQLKKLA